MKGKRKKQLEPASDEWLSILPGKDNEIPPGETQPRQATALGAMRNVTCPGSEGQGWEEKTWRGPAAAAKL